LAERKHPGPVTIFAENDQKKFIIKRDFILALNLEKLSTLFRLWLNIENLP
jgi:hypothetical protein